MVAVSSDFTSLITQCLLQVQRVPGRWSPLSVFYMVGFHLLLFFFFPIKFSWMWLKISMINKVRGWARTHCWVFPFHLASANVQQAGFVSCYFKTHRLHSQNEVPIFFRKDRSCTDHRKHVGNATFTVTTNASRLERLQFCLVWAASLQL